MLKLRLSKQALVLLVIIGLFFHISQVFHLYWEFWWVDVVLHLMSGALISMTVVIIWSYYYKKFKLTNLNIIGVSVALALFIGILWEIFELHYGITFLSDGVVYIRDTGSDLIMDICGGFFGALYALNTLKDNG